MKNWRITLLPALVLALGMGATEPAQADTEKTRTLITLHKEGGFAGLNDQVIVYTNGCVRLSRRMGPTVDECLTETEMRTLRAHLKNLRLGRSEPQPQGADFIKYTIAYRGTRVSRYTLPSSWSPVVRDLEKAMEKYWEPD
ncbi:hypothetical protein ABZ297_06980 [Nonomuraea sp. NPDC005983]|uniref:hypothetical protein n=1 Tax=Nonomuraea sp. NPDC005983 TaxID=3155595 RepID=UPI0033ADE468